MAIVFLTSVLKFLFSINYELQIGANMIKGKRAAFLLFFALLFASAGTLVSADSAYHELAPFTNFTTRELGWGGSHSAYNDDYNVLWTNPAALAPVSSSAAASIGVGIVGSATREASYVPSIFAGSGIDEPTLLRFAANNARYAPPDMYLHGPVSLVYIQKGFGMSINNRVFFESIINYIQGTGGMDTAVYRSNLNNDLVINIGHSYILTESPKGRLYWGFSAKLFYRNAARLSSADIEVPSQDGRKYNFIDSSAKNILGLGAGLGLFYSRERFSFGINISDALSGGIMIRAAMSDGVVGDNTFLFYPRIDMGVAYKLFENSQLKLIVMADLHDALGAFGVFGVNSFIKPAGTPLYNLSAGAEFVVHNFIALRAGMNDLMPSGGFGFIFGKLNVDFAFFGKNYNRAKAGDLVALGIDMSVRFKM
jgi:hypothetical protein